MRSPVFIDSDVIIASLLSSTGASHFLLNQPRHLQLCVSNYSVRELEEVIKRLDIHQESLNSLIKERFRIVEIKESISQIKELYKSYTTDINDTHVVAGAIMSKSEFIISYNIKDFNADLLKNDFKIQLTTPANFLQYLRSKKK